MSFLTLLINEMFPELGERNADLLTLQIKLSESIFSSDLAEKVVWFVGLKNTNFWISGPPHLREWPTEKVYGTVGISKVYSCTFQQLS